MSAAAKLCAEKVNEIDWLIVKTIDEGLDDSIVFDLRQAAEEADDLAADAPTDELAGRLRDAASRARAKADGRDAASTALDARRVDLWTAIRDADLKPPWLIDGYAARGYLTIEAGRGGEGKSLKALALAGGVLRGKPVAGHECGQGRVVIFDAENGVPLIGQRLRASDTPLEGLTIYESAGLNIAEDHRAIEQAIRVAGASFVVFDSLRTLAPRAKENDSDDMAPIMGALRGIARNTGAAVLLLHHRDKALEHDFRGSGVIHDQADLVFVLGRHPNDPDGKHRRYVRCAKCRIAEEPAERWLTIKHHRGQITLFEAAPYEAGAKHRTAPARDEILDKAIDVLAAADEPLAGAEIARRLDRGRTDQTVRRALNDLKTAGRLTGGNGQPWALVTPLVTPSVNSPATHPGPTPPAITNERSASEVVTTPDDTPTQPLVAAPLPLKGAPSDNDSPTTQLLHDLATSLDATEERT